MADGALNHAPNHVGFGIGPELCVVQDKVQGSPAPDVVQGGLRISGKKVIKSYVTKSFNDPIT